MMAARIGPSSPTITASRSAPGISPRFRRSQRRRRRVCAQHRLYRSTDGGKSFRDAQFATWRQSRDLDRSRQSESHDRWQRRRRHHSLSMAGNWTTQDNQPTAQFYHVSADNDFQFRVYGEQQDNSTFRHRDSRAIRRDSASRIGTPSAAARAATSSPDPHDSNIVYRGYEAELHALRSPHRPDARVIDDGRAIPWAAAATQSEVSLPPGPCRS